MSDIDSRFRDNRVVWRVVLKSDEGTRAEILDFHQS